MAVEVAREAGVAGSGGPVEPMAAAAVLVRRRPAATPSSGGGSRPNPGLSGEVGSSLSSGALSDKLSKSACTFPETSNASSVRDSRSAS
ncbi:MAG: hypothetical protein ACFCUP_05950, partial [Actinomycetales bacterium]